MAEMQLMPGKEAELLDDLRTWWNALTACVGTSRTPNGRARSIRPAGA